MAAQSPLTDLSAGLPPSLTLIGKAVIVTGSSRGIGHAIAETLAQRGANIAITYTSSKSTPKAEELAARIKALGRKVCIIQHDLALPDCGEVIVKKALEGLETTKIDILVNNAAIENPGGPKSVEDSFTPEAFDNVFRVNTRAPALLVKAVLPHLVENGGRIINISSIQSKMNFPKYSLYSATKAATDSLTRTWAKELAAKYRCTVNGILVGPTATPDAPDSVTRNGAKAMTTAEKRLGTMDDIAEIVAFVASEGSRWVNGDLISANGGIFIQS